MLKHYKLLIFSFLLLNLFLWVIEVEFKYGIPQIIKYLLSASVIVIILIYRLTYPLKPIPGGFFYPVIIVFTLWSIILLISAILNPDSILYPDLSLVQRTFGQQYFIIPYILPLILLFTRFDIEFFTYLFRYSFILIIPAILIQLYIIVSGISVDNYREQTNGILIFDLGSSILLLSAQLSRRKYVYYIVLLYVLILVFLYTQYGRRGMLLEYSLILFVLIIMRLKSSFLNFSDRISIYFTCLLMIILILSLGHLATSSYAFQRGFTKAAIEESRGVVFEAFFFDFNSASDWFFGRGIDGTVLRSTHTFEEAGLIENGFLTVLLKGGLLYLITFIIILLRASYLGLRKSNNDLIKALAYLLLIYLIMMIYFNIPSYSTNYILMWISISACFTPELRTASNEEIYRKINYQIYT